MADQERREFGLGVVRSWGETQATEKKAEAQTHNANGDYDNASDALEEAQQGAETADTLDATGVQER